MTVVIMASDLFFNVFRVLQERRFCQRGALCLPPGAVIHTNSMHVAHSLASRLRCATIFDFTASLASVEGYKRQPSSTVHACVRMDFEEYDYKGLRLLQPLVSAEQLEESFKITIDNWKDNGYPAAVLSPCHGEAVAFLVTQSRMDDSFSRLSFLECSASVLDVLETTLDARYMRFRMQQNWNVERFPSMYVLSDPTPAALRLSALSGPPIVFSSLESLLVTV